MVGTSNESAREMAIEILAPEVSIILANGGNPDLLGCWASRFSHRNLRVTQVTQFPPCCLKHHLFNVLTVYK